ncbi:MAG: DUF4157 domain-containing protein [Alphaproteobacteria bacterium]|nr:DUF4157 domain-containing protein [Alphaproteobacteria bacterium]
MPLGPRQLAVRDVYEEGASACLDSASAERGERSASPRPPPPSPTLDFAHAQLGNTWVLAALSGEEDALGVVTRAQLVQELSGVPSTEDGLGSNQAMLRAMRRARGAAPEVSIPEPRGGQALPEPVRARMERAFGHDFSHVRVHVDGEAAERARALQAHALTVGAHVFFGVGEWAPETPQGERLLAHELMHVVQHDEGRLVGVEGVSSPSDPLEQEAARAEQMSFCEPDVNEPIEAPLASPSAGAAMRAKDEAAHAEAREKIERVLQHLEAGAWDVDSLAAGLSAQDMSHLTHEERLRILTAVVEGWAVLDEDEQTALRLIETCPDPAALLHDLQQDGASLLQTLLSALDFQEHERLHVLLREATFTALGPEAATAAMDSAVTLPWADPGLFSALYNVRFAYEVCELDDQGKLHVKYWTNLAFFGMEGEELTLDPFELVRVMFAWPEALVGAQAGQSVWMPAVNLYGLYRKQFKQELGTAADVLLLMSGVGGLTAAGGRMAQLVATLEFAFGAADLSVQDLRPQLREHDEGRTFLLIWDKISTLLMIYGVARLLRALPELFAGLAEAWRQLRSRGEALDEGAKALGAQVDDLLRASRRLEALDGLDDEAKAALAACSEAELERVGELLLEHPEDAAGILQQMGIKGRKQAAEAGETFTGTPAAADALEQSLANQAQVRARGYPFGFDGLESFQRFKATLVEQLERHGLPTDHVAVHGSSVHKLDPGDVDVAVLVDQGVFDMIVVESFDASKKLKVQKEIRRLGGKGKFGVFYLPQLKPTFGTAIHGLAGDLKIQISLVVRGGPFDIGPYLMF